MCPHRQFEAAAYCICVASTTEPIFDILGSVQARCGLYLSSNYVVLVAGLPIQREKINHTKSVSP